MRTASPPYLRPDGERIQIKEWLTIKDGLPLPLSELMPEWDAATTVSVSISADIDVQGILTDCRLPPQAKLRLLSTWESAGTGLRDCGTSVEIDTSLTVQSVSLEINIPGRLLAGEVIVGISLILAAPMQFGERAAPKLPGSLLWREMHRIILEGTGARFPVEMVDFAKSFSWLPENAAWFLDWDRSDFTRPVLGSVRLYVNSNHKQLRDAVSGTHDAHHAVRDAVYFDIARSMIMAALDSEDFVEEQDKYAEESVGAAVRRLIRTLFSSDTFQELKQYRQQYPDRFECQLQDRLKLFWKD